ncbi:MAG TPA: metallophosphoesterase family protein [Caldilineae bacterium]|nr:metallophosphoesterase family protein [Caldilineae bacterium]
MTIFAIFSDVHDRRDRLERALGFLATREVDRYLQLGDLGPSPLALLDPLSVRHTFGNWEVSQLHHFPPERQPEIAAWPAQWRGEGWLAAHASPLFPSECTDLTATRRYMAQHRPRWMQLFPSLLHDEKAVWAAFAELGRQGRRVFFHGHTHVQAVQQLDPDNRYRRLQGPIIRLHPDALTLVGVGSVGAPRDGNALRCVLFDDEAWEVELVGIED